MAMVLAIVIGIIVVWGIFSVPELVIPFIILVVIAGACVGVKEKEEIKTTETTVNN